jgi:protein-L-isoaspartate(D-aspartate) O-methyltransferase
LRDGGIMIAPVGPERRDQSLVRVHREGDGHRIEALGGVRFVPLVRGLPRNGVDKEQE